MTNLAKNGYKGVPEWIQLQLPGPIRLHKYILRSLSSTSGGYHVKDFPNKFQMKGSNDGMTWTSIDSRDDVARNVTGSSQKKEFALLPSEPYQFFRLEIENVGSGGGARGKHGNGLWHDSHATIGEFSLFGEEYVEEESDTKSPSKSSPSKDSKSTMWNPMDDGFFSMSNLGMWTYVGVLALIVVLAVFLYMRSRSAPQA